MARSRSRKGGAPPRQARATSRKKTTTVATTQVEVVEEAQSMGTEDAVAIITALLLFVGILFLDYELGTHYDPHGLFF